LIDQSCYAAALKILARRAYSEKELQQKLSAKGYSEDEIQQVLPHLRQKKFIDDNKLCQSIFEQLVKSDKYGIKAIIARLYTRKLSREVIGDVVQEFNSATEFPRALALIQRRFKSKQPAERQKISRYLAYRGFSSATIVKVFEQIYSADNE
jgi:regulatory protein